MSHTMFRCATAMPDARGRSNESSFTKKGCTRVPPRVTKTQNPQCVRLDGNMVFGESDNPANLQNQLASVEDYAAGQRCQHEALACLVFITPTL